MIRGILAILSFSQISLAREQEDILPITYEPDHLVPLKSDTPVWSVRYMETLRPQLNLNAPFFARVLILPSSEGESCLRLHGDESDMDITKSTQFFLTSYQADKSIWYAMQENNDARKHGKVTVGVSSTPVSKAFAKRLRAIWDQMLSQTRQPEKPNPANDGVIYEFSTPERSGQTWSPRANNSPKLFVNLTQSLHRYCKAPPVDRPGVMKSLELHILALERYLEKHPVK